MTRTTTVAVPPTFEPLPASYVPVELIDPHPDNPRREFDVAKLAELEKSVREKGVLEPLLVRRHGDRVQLICGERRWRAAKAAGVPTVPCLFRDDLDETAILEFMLIENTHREDVSELEEAESYHKLMGLNKSYTTETIAAKVGMSVRHVQARLELLRLVEGPKDALRQHSITAGHAQLIARLPAAAQYQALGACFHDVDLRAVPPEEQGLLELAKDVVDEGAEYEPNLVEKKRLAAAAGRTGKVSKEELKAIAAEIAPRRLVSVRELDDWIKTHVRVDRAQLQEEIPGLADSVQQAAAEKIKVIEISFLERDAVPHDYNRPEAEREALTAALRRVVFAGNWKRADGTKNTTRPDAYSDKMVDSPECEHGMLGVVTFGPRLGEQVKVCVAKKQCKVHWAAEQRAAKQATSYRQSPVDQAAQRARWAREQAENERQRKLQRAMRPAVIAAVLKKATPATHRAYYEASVRRTEWWGDFTSRFVKPLKINLTAIERATIEKHPELAPGSANKPAKKDAPKKARGRRKAGKKR